VRTFDVVATGDLLLHWPILERAYDPTTGRYDFRPMFARIRPLIRRAALALCHVETPIGAGSPSSYPIFNAPAALADAIRSTGWDACSTASNHSVDRGVLGIRTTRENLDRVGVRATGTARTKAESRRTLLLRVGEVRIAFLSYTYGTNGLPLPTRWSVDLLSPTRIRADARRARRLGAELVIVNLHWGAEYSHEPTLEQKSLARYLLRRRIVDAIVGQHAHVVQPIRRRFGRFVVYGEGNLISNQTAACCPAASQDGLIAILRVRVVQGEASIRRVDYVPVYVRHPDFAVLPVGTELARAAAAGRGGTAEAAELRRSYRDTVAVAGRSAFVAPVRGPFLRQGPGRGRARGGTCRVLTRGGRAEELPSSWPRRSGPRRPGSACEA
jgi:Bacterial capsule synthesis protein PGA_cap